MRTLSRAVLVALALGCAAGCSGSPPAVIPPVTGSPDRLVVLGADSAFGADLRRTDRLRDSWPQLVLGALPPGSSMVNLAAPGATLTDFARRQVAEASTLQPTIAIVSFEAGLNADDPSGNTAVQIVDQLRAAGANKVLVVDVAASSADSASLALVGQHGATVVTPASKPAAGPEGDRQIADAIELAAGVR